MYDRNFLDTMEILAFIVGIMNYNENLTQDDKDDIMNSLDRQTKDILVSVQKALNEQNEMLKEILRRLDEHPKN